MENFTMDYYKYWEEFVEQWFKGNDNAIKGWSNPDMTPALCNTKGDTQSSLYIPEPWWGNDGTKPLHSVVINFNPGLGGQPQERERVPYYNSYAKDIINYKDGSNPKKWPNNTANWHYTRRAKPIQEQLGLTPSLESHLSIELIPWHTAGVDNKNYGPYLEHNIEAVYKYSICFAAHESKRIANNYLKNVVLLKMSGDFTKRLLQNMEMAHCCKHVIIAETDGTGKAYYLEFSLNTWPDVRFICIWGRYSQNNFPVSQLKQFFTELKIIK